MEFPNTGRRCHDKECKQLDFLPFTCNYCSEVFCKDHYHISSHSCSKYSDNVTDNLKKLKTFECSYETCCNKSVIELPCPKCQSHFCLTHRYHNCFEHDLESKTNQSNEWEKLEKEFKDKKTSLDQSIAIKLKNSKNHQLANKIKIMKLKNKSSGLASIPQSERCYFHVLTPNCSKSGVQDNFEGIFVSTNWSVGKIIDFISTHFNILNDNNVAKSKKLRLFHQETGIIITNQMDATLSELLHSNQIVEGQNIAVKYIDQNN